MDEKIKVEVIGLSLSRGKNTPFVVILSEKGSKVCLPIIIGESEAQSIAVALENHKPPRPLTHDSFASMLKTFEIELSEIFIYNYYQGVFTAEMLFSHGDLVKHVDCRPSDGIALALRTASPIYTTRDIIENAGITIAEHRVTNDADNIDEKPLDRLKTLDQEHLKALLDEAVKDERYEDAALINAEIKHRGSIGL